MKEIRKRRKNFLPTVIVALIFWVALIFTVFKISPDSWFSFLIFYSTFFIAAFLSLALVLAHSRRGLTITLILLGLLLLRQLKLASVLNVALLIVFLLSWEIYLSRH